MAKYGFDYFVKRGEVLSEMARQWNPLLDLGEHGQIASDLFNKAGRIMQAGGVLSDGTKVPGLPPTAKLTNRKLRYFIHMMADLDSDIDPNVDDISDKESSASIANTATEILGIPPTGWKNDEIRNPDVLYRKAIIKGVDEKYKDRIQSPKFIEELLKSDNVLNFVVHNRTTNAYSQAKARQKVELHGGKRSIEELDDIATSNSEIIKKINNEQKFENARKLKKYGIVVTDSMISNDRTAYKSIILFVLNEVKSYAQFTKTTVNNTLKKFNQSEGDEEVFNDIIEDVSGGMKTDPVVTRLLYFANIATIDILIKKYTNTGDAGTTPEEFAKDMDMIKSAYPDNENLIDLLEFIEFRCDPMFKEIEPQEEQEFPTYNKQITDKYLTTPELKDHFRKWFNYEVVEKINILKNKEAKENILDIGSTADIDRGFDEFVSAKPDRKKEMDKKAFGSVNDAQQALGKAKFKESYIMEYMTEQLQKDSLNNPKGEFKDRGFKKPTNYGQWMMNQ
tara:strand:+ start:1 stop:1521 length:1521 start_codon:yes stop_codon:yes gene_type:complete